MYALQLVDRRWRSLTQDGIATYADLVHVLAEAIYTYGRRLKRMHATQAGVPFDEPSLYWLYDEAAKHIRDHQSGVAICNALTLIETRHTTPHPAPPVAVRQSRIAPTLEEWWAMNAPVSVATSTAKRK